jgi:hypothetical protein
MNMYSILDRLTFEESCVRADQGIAGQFPSRVSYLIDEVQIGSVDSVSKLLEDIFTIFPVDSRPIRFGATLPLMWMTISLSLR